MLKKIAETTAFFSLGLAAARKLFRLDAGEYAGRMIAVIHTSGEDIKFTYADTPYVSWSTAVSIATDAANRPSDAVMDSNGNVHLFYSDSSDHLVTRKLAFANGNWSVGNAVVVYDAYPSRNPSATVEPGGKLWIGWGREVNGSFSLCVKSSTTDGATWGSGSSDAGDILVEGCDAVFPKLVLLNDRIVALYSADGTFLAVRSRLLSGGTWESATTVASGMELDNNYDAAVSAEGMLAVVYDINQLKYREFDGSNWGPVINLDSSEGHVPQIFFVNGVPFVVYLSPVAENQMLYKYTSRKSGSFSEPLIFDGSASWLGGVCLYQAASATYADLTDAASNDTPADVLHPGSGAIIKEAGDVAYLGMEEQFRSVYFKLFTAGLGGSVVYSYFDGVNWKAFTPAGGNFALDTTEKTLLLWDDSLAMPSDWQKTNVNGGDLFWIRIETSSQFSVAPVGTMVTAIADCVAFTVRR
jgi:hypothetical protein